MNRTAISLGAVSAAGVAAAWVYLRRSKSSEGLPDDDAEEVPYVSRDQLVEFFETINMAMQHVVQEGQMIYQQYSSQIPEAQLMVMLGQRFEQALEEQQQKFLDRWDVTEDELEVAASCHADDPAVRQGVKMLEMLYAVASGRPPQEPEERDVPAGMTEAKLCQILERCSDAILELMAVCVAEFRQSGKTLDSQESLMDLERLVGERSHSRLAEVLRQFKITQEGLMAAQMKFKDSEKVMRMMFQCQHKQQAGFAALGIAG